MKGGHDLMECDGNLPSLSSFGSSLSPVLPVTGEGVKVIEL